MFVSHSDQIARGLVELAAQMAPSVSMKAAGGMDDGGIGTSYDKVLTAVKELLEEDLEVLLLTDLGSATMTVEAVVEEFSSGVHFQDAPLVEGAVAASVTAEQGGTLLACANAAVSAGAEYEAPEMTAQPADEAGGTYSRTAVVADDAGLHARPAAQVAAMAGQYEGDIFINETPADSIMEMMTLGIKKGDTVTVSTDDPECHRAVDKIAAAIAAGLDS
ncbi:MAG: dihydroxyacetone kinase phosphoryl donor subunit DhaM [Flaviflexus sp.]|nr:dihydroxyacetone kinase phosphoryl donor subunit DhaM [Flaviflexus sp.]